MTTPLLINDRLYDTQITDESPYDSIAVTKLAHKRPSTGDLDSETGSSPLTTPPSSLPLPPPSLSLSSPHVNALLPSPVPLSPALSSSSSSSSSSDISPLPLSSSAMSAKMAAEVTHTTISKPPVLTQGTLSPEILHQFENACCSFFRNKEGLEPKDYVPRIAGGLQDLLLADWYWTNQQTLDGLSFDAFMKELRTKWLPNDWEQDIQRKVLGSKQSGPFWEWAVRITSLNTLLHGMAAHLDDNALLNQLEANLEPWLSRACDDDHVKGDDLDKWMDKVKILDEKKRRERLQQKADAEEAARLQLKRNTTTAGLSEPSRRYNTFRNPMNEKASGNKQKNFDVSKTLPKLTDVERQLLYDNEGCLKCRRFFVNHRSANCPNDFPSAANYKTLLADDVSAAKRKGNSSVAVMAESSCGSGALPIMAIMPPTNKNLVLEGNSSDLSKIPMTP